MAFLETGWAKVSVSLNQPIQTLESGVVVGAPTFYSYQSSTDAIATIGANDYFAAKVYELCEGDVIFCTGSDASEHRSVTNLVVSPLSVDTSALAVTGAVGTANLDALAVTTAKIDANAVTTGKIALDTIQYLKVTMSAANFNGMYAAPFQILAAPGADKLIVVEKAMLVVDFGAAAFAAGGVFGLQYDTDVNKTGTDASETGSAANAQWAADSTFLLDGKCPTGLAANTVNKSICMSNLTAAFTTGDSVVDVHIWYKIVTAGL
jgi:hypothetical protein